MKTSRKITDVPEDNRGEQAHRSAAPSVSLIFMDAATNLRTEELTEENVRKYTLGKYNMDVTKHMDDLKTMTRSAVQKENKQLVPPNKPKDSVRTKRKITDAIAEREKDLNENNMSSNGRNAPETLDANLSPIVEGNAVEDAAENAASSMEKSKKAVAAKSKAPEKKTDSKKDVKSTQVVQKTLKAKSDELKGMTKTSVKRTGELKGKAAIVAKKEFSALKGKAKTTVKKEPAKLREATKTEAKKESSKMKGTTKTVAKKERAKLKRTTKTVARKEPAKVKGTTKTAAKKDRKK